MRGRALGPATDDLPCPSTGHPAPGEPATDAAGFASADEASDGAARARQLVADAEVVDRRGDGNPVAAAGEVAEPG